MKSLTPSPVTARAAMNSGPDIFIDDDQLATSPECTRDRPRRLAAE